MICMADIGTFGFMTLATLVTGLEESRIYWRDFATTRMKGHLLRILSPSPSHRPTVLVVRNIDSTDILDSLSEGELLLDKLFNGARSLSRWIRST